MGAISCCWLSSCCSLTIVFHLGSIDRCATLAESDPRRDIGLLARGCRRRADCHPGPIASLLHCSTEALRPRSSAVAVLARCCGATASPAASWRGAVRCSAARLCALCAPAAVSGTPGRCWKGAAAIILTCGRRSQGGTALVGWVPAHGQFRVGKMARWELCMDFSISPGPGRHDPCPWAVGQTALPWKNQSPRSSLVPAALLIKASTMSRLCCARSLPSRELVNPPKTPLPRRPHCSGVITTLL